jgi:hypothetical protein
MVVHIDFALAPCRRIAGNRLAAIAKVGESRATERQLSPLPLGEEPMVSGFPSRMAFDKVKHFRKEERRLW